MKKVLMPFWIGLFITLMIPFSCVKAADGAVNLSGGGNVNNGSDLTVTVSYASTGARTCAIKFDVAFPADKMAVKSRNLGDIFTVPTPSIAVTSGNIHYELGAFNCSTESATLLTVIFSTTAAGSGNITTSNASGYGGADGSTPLAFSSGSTPFNIKDGTTGTTKSTVLKKPAAVAVTPIVFSKIGYASDSVLDKEHMKVKGITFSGTANPDSDISLTLHSTPITGTAKTDASGNWSFTLNDWINDGPHTIQGTAKKGSDQSPETQSDFILSSTDKTLIAYGVVLPTEAKAASTPTPAPVTTPAPAKSKFSSKTIMYAGIGGGIIVLIAVVVLIIILIRKRRSAKSDLNFADKTGDAHINNQTSTANNSSSPDQSNEPVIAQNDDALKNIIAPVNKEPQENNIPHQGSSEQIAPNPDPNASNSEPSVAEPVAQPSPDQVKKSDNELTINDVAEAQTQNPPASPETNNTNDIEHGFNHK